MGVKLKTPDPFLTGKGTLVAMRALPDQNLLELRLGYEGHDLYALLEPLEALRLIKDIDTCIRQLG